MTSLPSDATTDEVHAVFSRCGVIAEEIDEGKPRIKLYSNSQGNFKGDALIMFFRPESVPLAIQLLDDTEFRLGEGQKMKVAEADFSYKAQKDAPKQSNMKTKKKIIKKTQKLNKYVAVHRQPGHLEGLQTLVNLRIGTMMILRPFRIQAHDGIKWLY